MKKWIFLLAVCILLNFALCGCRDGSQNDSTGGNPSATADTSNTPSATMPSGSTAPSDDDGTSVLPAPDMRGQHRPKY